jgi:MFS family permease
MAVMQALLQIKADVKGEGQVNALGRALGGIQQKAAAASAGLKGLTAAAGMGGLAGSFGALAPLLSVGGLVAMTKKTLDAGNEMFNLSQKTGVSVEALARFKKAASTSGTDVETVAKAITKLSKGMLEAAQTGKGPTASALQSLGVSATDASGKLRSADAVMLDIATRFKAMPDGAQKTALAMQLFGKSGAELVPMLNLGGEAIDKMKVKMTTAFAQKADEYSDKLTALGGKVGSLGADIAMTLLPVLDKLADGVTAVVDWFNKLDPSIRNTIVAVSLFAISFGAIATVVGAVVGALGTIGGAIAGVTAALGGASIGATIAGWLPVVVSTIGGIIAALGGLVTFITGTLVPGILAVVTGPVGITVLLLAAIVALFVAFREPIMNFLSWAWENIVAGFQKIADWYLNVYIAFWLNLWNNLIVQPITKFLAWFGATFIAAWNGYISMITGIWNTAAGTFQEGWRRAGQFITGIWQGIVNGLRGIVNGFFQGFFGQINGAIRLINLLIAGFNRIPNVPDIPYVPSVGVPRFAEGGVVDRPTLAMVGEGGEREYIIPESKMAGAAAAYLGGARGASVMGPSPINITTGPVMQQQGQNWVTMADLQQAMRATEAATLQRIRTPAGRAALGIR